MGGPPQLGSNLQEQKQASFAPPKDAASINKFPDWHKHLSWKLAAVAIVLLALVYAAWKTFSPSASSTLVVKIQHSFRSAQLAVSIDGEQVYQSQLAGVVRKKFGLLESVQGSFAHSIPISEGDHTVQIHVFSPEGFDQSKQAQIHATAKTVRTVTAVADKRSGNLYLGLRDEAGVVSTEGSTSGYGKLLASLLLTVAGSILSAVVGFLVQERLAVLRGKRRKAE